MTTVENKNQIILSISPAEFVGGLDPLPYEIQQQQRELEPAALNEYFNRLPKVILDVVSFVVDRLSLTVVACVGTAVKPLFRLDVQIIRKPLFATESSVSKYSQTVLPPMIMSG